MDTSNTETLSSLYISFIKHEREVDVAADVPDLLSSFIIRDCWSTRVAYEIRHDAIKKTVVHAYTAMGLCRQRSDTATILFRVYSAEALEAVQRALVETLAIPIVSPEIARACKVLQEHSAVTLLAEAIATPPLTECQYDSLYATIFGDN